MDETSYINESIFNNDKEFLETKDIPKIQKSICLFKYYNEKNNKIVGTGFFLKFRYEDKYMHILLTSNHVRKIENYDNFIYYFQENKKKSLPLKNRKIYQSGKNELDYTCIQILNEDKITNFLNIDDNALNETYPWEGKQIYIYNYEFKLSWGKIVKKKIMKLILFIMTVIQNQDFQVDQFWIKIIRLLVFIKELFQKIKLISEEK